MSSRGFRGGRGRSQGICMSVGGRIWAAGEMFGDMALPHALFVTQSATLATILETVGPACPVLPLVPSSLQVRAVLLLTTHICRRKPGMGSLGSLREVSWQLLSSEFESCPAEGLQVRGQCPGLFAMAGTIPSASS